MCTTPDESPVTTPAEPTVAIIALLVDHVPPDGVAVKVTGAPMQETPGPEMVAPMLTVTGLNI